MAYNTSTHDTTGFTPFFLMFGRQARIPTHLMYGTAEPESLDCGEYAAQLRKSMANAYRIARESSAGKQERQAEMYNEKVHGKPHDVGSLVWLLNPQVPRGKSKKMHKWWTGPYRVVKRISDVTYRVQHTSNRAKRMVGHFDRLKQCHPRTRFEGNTSPPTQESSNLTDSTPSNSWNSVPFGCSLQVVEEAEDTHVPEQSRVQLPQPITHPPFQPREHPNLESLPTRRYPTRTRRPPSFFDYSYGTYS